MELVEVDGSFGEGGGQTLRTAMAFSIIKGRPIHITKIRAGREVPGLRRQHVAALKILNEVSGGELSGAEVGSPEVSFTPGVPRSAILSFDTGSAASVTLVLQAIIPAVAISGKRLAIHLIGGTDVPWSPTYDYFATVVRRGFEKVGIRFKTASRRRGYYPRGGGRVEVEIEPCTALRAAHLDTPHGAPKISLQSRCAGLPRHVAERQLETAASVVEGAGLVVAERVLAEEPADSPGSSMFVGASDEGRIMGGDAIGAKGRPAEDVGRDAANRLVSCITSGAAVDSNLGDMLAPILTLADAPSVIRVPEVSSHLETGLHIASLFSRCRFGWKREGSSTLVTITPESR